MDGFYCAYLTGHAGNTILMFILKDGVIVGVDGGGMKYDGTFERNKETIEFSVVYLIPNGGSLITGAPRPAENTKIPFQFTLPLSFADGGVHQITTPLGPVNARIDKLRAL